MLYNLFFWGEYMIDENWKNNELYQLLLSNVETSEKATEMFLCILPYLLKHYGEENITIQNLLFIRPVELYKNSIVGTKSYYKDFVNVIFMYKATTGDDSGFRIKVYEDIYNTNVAYENALAQKRLVKEQHKVLAIKNQLKKKKTKTAIVKKEDFDENLIVTRQNIINYIQKQYDITFLSKEDILSSFAAKNLFNYRYGSLVYNDPFVINNIKDQSVYWIGMCDCGNFRITQAGRIKDYKSCSKCMELEHIYIGEKYGHLKCIDQKYILCGKHNLKLQLKCKCDCGSEIIISPKEFISKNYCSKVCKYAIQHRAEIYKDNGKAFKNTFYKDTNIGKIGRTGSNSNSSTGYLGVTFIPQTGKYMAYITFQHKTEQLGTYKTPEEAYKVRMTAQNMLHIKYINELDEMDFVQNNRHLKKLLNKVKATLTNTLNESIEKI